LGHQRLDLLARDVALVGELEERRFDPLPARLSVLKAAVESRVTRGFVG
jgi:hypothetical protein